MRTQKVPVKQEQKPEEAFTPDSPTPGLTSQGAPLQHGKKKKNQCCPPATSIGSMLSRLKITNQIR